MARTQRRFSVGLASFTSRVHLKVFTLKGALRAEYTLSLEEFNQLFAECQEVHEQIRGPVVVQFPRGTKS